MSRRRRGGPPELCKHKASGRAYVTDPRTGREVYFGPWGSGEAEEKYERWRREFVAWSQAGSVQKAIPPGGLTVGQLLARHLAWAREHFRKDGHETSEVHLYVQAARFVLELYPTFPVVEFRPGHFKALRELMISQGLARHTVNAFAGRIRRVFAWGAENELIPEEVWRRLVPIRNIQQGRGGRETEDVGPVPWVIVERCLPHMLVVPALMVRVQYLTAMRPGEVCQLRGCDLDQSALPWVFRPRHHKNEHRGKKRLVLIGPQARAILAPLLATAGSPETWLFRGRRGQCYRESSYRTAVYRACQAAGLPDKDWWAPNQLRHAMATEIRARFQHPGIHPLEASQAVLGHASADMAEIYALQGLDLARQVIEELG